LTKITTLLVHLRTREQYEAEKRAHIQSRIKEFRQQYVPRFYTPEEFERRLQERGSSLQNAVAYEESYWPSWRFNDVVGYVELCYSGHDILAYAFLARGRNPRGFLMPGSRGRISRSLKHKEFVYCDVFHETAAVQPWNSDEGAFNNRSVRRAVESVVDQVKAFLETHKPRLYLDYDGRLTESIDFIKLLGKQPEPIQ
jgi:hypothetical protein